MGYKNKEKLKEQNNSRITEPKNGLTVTKGKGTGDNGREGRDKGVVKEKKWEEDKRKFFEEDI